MNIEVMNVVKNAMIKDIKENPTKIAELETNPAIAVSYSDIEGFCALYPNKEAALVALEEVKNLPDVDDLSLSSNGLVVSCTFLIPNEAQGFELELYCGCAQAVAELSGTEFISNWVDLHHRANQMWMADTSF